MIPKLKGIEVNFPTPQAVRKTDTRATSYARFRDDCQCCLHRREPNSSSVYHFSYFPYFELTSEILTVEQQLKNAAALKSAEN